MDLTAKLPRLPIEEETFLRGHAHSIVVELYKIENAGLNESDFLLKHKIPLDDSNSDIVSKLKARGLVSITNATDETPVYFAFNEDGICLLTSYIQQARLLGS